MLHLIRNMLRGQDINVAVRSNGLKVLNIEKCLSMAVSCLVLQNAPFRVFKSWIKEFKDNGRLVKHSIH